MLSKNPGNKTGNDAPQVEVVSAKYQHPVLDRVGEEVTAETYQQNHHDTIDEGSDDTASDAAICVRNDSSGTSLKEAGEGQRNNDAREDSHRVEDENGNDAACQ